MQEEMKDQALDQPTDLVEQEAKFVTLPTEDIDKKLENVEKAFQLIGKLRTFALKHLSPKSITNEGGNPYITESGVNVFDAPFAIYEKDVEGVAVKENGMQLPLSDPDAFKGQLQCIIYKGIVGSKTLGIEFSFEGGVYYSEKDIKFHAKEDFLFFAKKAKANWRGRARRKLLGLDNITWEELANYNITPANCVSVERKKGKEAPKDQGTIDKENETRGKIATMLSEFITDAESRSNQLEDLTSFKGKDGTQVPGVRDPKKMSGKRLDIAYNKVKEWHKKTQENWG